MEKALPGTMVLVIGIILGAFVAMILIVIFVLKKRIRVDGNGTIKGDEGAGATGAGGGAGVMTGPTAPRYQFAPPNDYGEMPGGAGTGGGASAPLMRPGTATTALMEGGGGGGRGPPPRPGGPTAPPPPPMAGPPPPSNHNNNGFFNNNCGGGGLAGAVASPANGASDRSRLFRKTNGSKPVREWYV